MTRPVLLDACCGVGGASVGYHRAGFDVVGVDINPQPDYPYEFIQGDAVQFIKEHGTEFDALHASWPCQAANPLTTGTNAARNAETGRVHPQLIPGGREVLEASGRPWLIENTAGAPIRKDLKLVGDMFGGLAVWRPRYFELSGFTVPQPRMPKKRGRTRGWRHGTYYDGPYLAVYGEGGGKGTVAEWKEAMGIDWTDVRKSIAEAIPPEYAEYIGLHLITNL